jgi:hypothetical protein
MLVRTQDEARVLLNSEGVLVPSTVTAVGFRAAPRRSLVCCDPVDVAADFSGDGRLDVILGERNVILIGLGDGNFLAPQVLSGHPPEGLTATGDFDGDRNTDLLYFLNGSAAVMLGNGDGTFRPGAVVSPGDGAVYAADLDGDGRSDVVHIQCFDCNNDFRFTPNWGGSVQLFFADSGGYFREPVTLSVPAVWSRQLTIADWNSDGRPDIVSSAWLLLNQGSRTFDDPRQYRPVFDLEPPSLGPAGASDLDGDGVPELLWYDTVEGRTIAALRIGVDGLPSLRYTNGFLFSAWDTADRRIGGVADFDGDGRPDLISAVFGPGDGRILPILPRRPEASVTILYNRIPK